MLLPSTLNFLHDLKAHNDRTWFMEHKPAYERAHENACALADAVLDEMRRHDELENESGKKSLFRIYKDVRFSKDKSPYKTHFSFAMKRATKLRRGGYYVHLEPGSSFLACGFFGPNPDDLKRIRQDIDMNNDQWRKLLRSKALKENFGEMIGETVNTAPRGYATDHPAIDLLRHKQFLFEHAFTDKEVLAAEFPKQVSTLFKSIRPWLDYMSVVLSTNANGERVV